LEADGWLQFNEQNFTPSTVEFTATKKELYLFQEAHPEYENMLTTLLRTYEGIFDHPVFISEKVLVGLLRIAEESIKKELLAINRYGIITYKAQSDTPQIIFRKQRVPVDDLKVDLTLYNKRKKSFMRRVEKMIAYTELKNCRSAFINVYFGDATPPCGVCDNCLAAKGTPLTPEEFDGISKQLMSRLSSPQKAEHLIEEIKGHSKEKVWKVLLFLQAEGKVAADDLGRLHLKKATGVAPSPGGSSQS
jgi:ATP-dependent DNA helicase RecQ